ncbi:MAG: S8 family serine peptidase [Candidatus Thermoplasmatota archaeon]|nr:S8 family serine peptidase [Candidatus Thermoplasmatota archaeon]
MGTGDGGSVNSRIASILFTATVLLSTLSIITTAGAYDPLQVKEHPLLWTLRGPIDMKEVTLFFPYIPEDDTTPYHIVQFDHIIQETDIEMLRELGMTLLDYLPDNAFVVRDGTKSIDHLYGEDIRHIPLPSSMKLSPVIWEVLQEGELSDHFSTMVVETFYPSDDAFEALSELGPTERSSLTRYHVRTLDFMRAASITDVKWVEPLAEHVLMNEISSGILDVDTVRSIGGLDGTGQTVAIADTGLDTGVDAHNVTGDIHDDFDNRVIFRNWAGTSPDDGYGHGTHVAGSVAGDGSSSGGSIQGMAPNATIVFQGIATDSDTLATPGNLSDLFKQAYDLGARVHTNSWGSDGSYFWGRYTSESYDVDWSMFHYPDQLILFSAGNDGTDTSPQDGKIDPGSVSPPATAKSALTVGASENVRSSGGLQGTWGQGWGYPMNPVRNDHVSNNADGLAAFSSRGPTLDNRLKPDVVAPGTNILSTRSSVPGSITGWGVYNTDYLYMGGTSMSTPITAGTAALVRQYYDQTMGEDRILASLVKATLINGAVDMTPGQYGSSNPTTQEINSRPDNDQGWGRVNMKASLYPDQGKLTYENNWDGLSTGQNFSRVFRVNSNEELRVTLAWSDHPGSYFSGKQLVNDLDLVLIAPDGTIYHGNDISAPFNDTKDDLNPVEGVTIPDPSMGWWKMEVRAANVPLGPQHFAIVASGNITEFITNSMVFDRQFYSTDDSLIQIRLTGKDLIGSASIQVNITSTSQPLGKTVTLFEEGEYGSFVGSIRTSNTSTDEQYRLYVEPEDTIYAWYSNSLFEYFYQATAYAKKPTHAGLWYLPENHLVYSIGDTITFKGRSVPGTDVEWSIEGSDLGWRELNDKGSPSQGDDIAGDGNYSSLFYVSEEMRINGHVILRVRDPYLGYLYYGQFGLEINTSSPRAPTDLVAEARVDGNAVGLSWKRTGGVKLDHHRIFMNRTPLELDHGMENWIELFDTDNSGNYTEVTGLADGVGYYFRVSSVWEDGNVSSPSHWAFGTPMDMTPPSLDLINEPFTLAGNSTIEFDGDDDLERVEVQYYNDRDRDGIANDNGNWVAAGNSTGPIFVWDTRMEAGGPGNLDNMIIRARGTDEVPNTGEWSEFSGFSVDNIGPSVLIWGSYPDRITNVAHYSNLLGKVDPLSRIELHVNGIIQNETTAGQSGIFGLSLDLYEGYNSVKLVGYDDHGAGPTTVGYEFTLDTLSPVPVIEEFNTTVEASEEGIDITSVSYDLGIDPDFMIISGQTWELVMPTGERRFGEGENFHIDIEQLGVHTIKLSVEDPARNKASTELAFIVVDTTSPEISYEGSFIVDEDTAVEYSSSGTRDNGPCTSLDRCAVYNWTFTGVHDFVHYSSRWETTVVFPDPGEYFGRLMVEDPSGNSDVKTFSISVRDITPPTGGISGPKQVIFGERLELYTDFTDNSGDPLNASSYQWKINFLNEYGVSFRWMELEGAGVQLFFDDTGNYTFDLTVTDSSGNTRNVSHRVWVTDPPDTEEDVGPTKEERSWTVIILIALVVLLVLLAAAVLIWFMKREDIRTVDWDDEDDELDDIDIDEDGYGLKDEDLEEW